MARELGCDTIIHTANQSQNSLRRLNGALSQLGYEGCFGTPYERSVLTRDEKIEALRRPAQAALLGHDPEVVQVPVVESLAHIQIFSKQSIEIVCFFI
mgnify:CR=1 FL=1